MWSLHFNANSPADMFMTSWMRFQDVEMRRALPGDLKDIIKIERCSFDHEAFSETLLASFLKDRCFLTLLVIDGVESIAYATILKEEAAASIRIVSLAVVPQSRNRGVALSLMRRIEAIADELGSRRMNLEVGVANIPAINLYLKLGFVIKGSIADYYGEGRDALYMERPLPPVSGKAPRPDHNDAETKPWDF